MNAERTHETTPDATRPVWVETLRDHRRVLIRSIDSSDREAEKAFIEGLSSEARRFRFLGQIGQPSEALLRQLTDIDPSHELAYVALVLQDGHERIVGVSRYSADAGNRNCECAVTVDDDWRDQGLGTLLMRHLIDGARERGIRYMYSIDVAENVRMNELADHLGFTTRSDPDEASQVLHELDLRQSVAG